MASQHSAPVDAAASELWERCAALCEQLMVSCALPHSADCMKHERAVAAAEGEHLQNAIAAAAVSFLV